MTIHVVTMWRRELVNINKTRDNHLARFGQHFDHTLLVRTDRTIASHIEAYGTHVHHISPGPLGFLGFWLKALWWLRTNHAVKKIDAVIFPIGEEPVILPARYLLGNNATRPQLILDLWDVPGLALEGSDQSSLKSMMRKLYLGLLPTLLNTAHIVISGVVNKPFLKMGISAEKIIETENGVNTDIFKPVEQAGSFWASLPDRTENTIRLLYQGYIHQARGSLAMVQMVSDLRGQGYDVQLLLVGPTDHKQKKLLANSSTESDVSDYVLTLENIDSNEIPAVISEADICLCPLADIEKYRWSYPVKIYEYMAMGKVVVASKLPGIERMITCKSIGGCLFDPADFRSMANSVRWLIENPEKHNYIARRGLDYAKTKSWDSIVRTLAEKIEAQVVSRRAG